jgi:hypothetical protein
LSLSRVVLSLADFALGPVMVSRFQIDSYWFFPDGTMQHSRVSHQPC